jgi:acyl-CoA thioesterase
MDLQEIRRIIDEDRFAAHMDIEFRLVEEGHAVTRMPLKEQHDNFMGMVHGGSIFAVADAAFSAASNASGIKAVAAHISIDYLAAPGETAFLEAEARLTARAGRAGYYEMQVRDDTGEVIAVCHGRVRYTSESLEE